MDKSGWRAQIKERTGKLTTVEKESQSQKIANQLADFLSSQEGVWSLYYPLQDEPQLLSLMKQCSHIQWVFPLIVGEDQALDFYQVQSTDDMVLSDWGVFEPNPEKEQHRDAASLTGLIVPGMAFDRQGVRLGRGGGHYDRTLQITNGFKIGVAFDSAFTDSLPQESHDQFMNIVVTPNDWVEVAPIGSVRKEVTHGI